MPQILASNINNFALALSFFAIALSLWTLWQNRKTNRLRKAFFASKNGQDLEHIILSINQKLHGLENESLLNSEEIKRLQIFLNLAIQKVGIVRYSPFADGGGNYSFSLALLNAHNSGIIITNMYGRQQSRVYTKKLTQGKSEVQLTEEELSAVELANHQNSPLTR